MKHYKNLINYNMADEVRESEIYKNGVLSFYCYNKYVEIVTASDGGDEFNEKVSRLSAEGIIQRLGLYDLMPKQALYKSLCGTYIYEGVEQDLREYLSNENNRSILITICTLNIITIEIRRNANLLEIVVSVNDERKALLSVDFNYYLEKIKTENVYTIGKNIISAVQSVKPQILAVEMEKVCG